MSVFQKSVINKHLKNLDNEKVNFAYKKFQKFYGDKLRLQNIMHLKEENYQEGFLREIFVQVLGYTINPDNEYNLTTEFKNLKDSRKADGAILKNGNAIGVIELKSTKTRDLESIKEQAFGYKNNQPNCKYVITSNFQSLRFYIDNATENEEFNLFDLSEERFKIFYLLLNKENILSHLPERLKQETKSHDEQITRKLYKDYQSFKNRIFDFLCSGNPQYDKLTLFKKSQKLLDRFLFILFAEDSGLIPPNAISKIIEQWRLLKELEKDDTLYSRFQLFFTHLDKGHSYKNWGEIPAYNGGLFLYDYILDSPELKLPDGLLQNNLPVLSAYDYSSEVDVNILGHIFEHSLSEIEEMERELTSQKFETFEKLTSKRKKDGIFYTPKYITKYIVENTVGTLCKEKKNELQINDLLIDDTFYVKAQGRAPLHVQAHSRASLPKLNPKGKQLFQTLQTYKTWLLSLKILDPACGSGAFLNATLDFLIAEHKEIDNIISELTGDKMRIFDTDKQILENNIFGVDINEESVEIAKLSLWLRTAQKGRVLSDLSNNIKCGNSLIDTSDVAGEKAFNWNIEFKEIMDNGGFDVVIGNPPYVRVQQLKYDDIDFLKKNYKTALKRIDISLCFIELSSKIIKNETGLASFITSNQFLTTEYGQSMRRFLLKEYNLIECVDFGDLPIFDDALTYVSIFIFSKNFSSTFHYSKVESIAKAIDNDFGKKQTINISQLSDNNWILKNFALIDVFANLHHQSTIIGKIGNAWAGLITGNDDILMLSPNEIEELGIENEVLLPVIRANNCSKYLCSKAENYVIYPYKFENGKTIVLSETELQENYPNAFNYLLRNKIKLEKRKDSRKTFVDREDWYSLTRFGQKNIFEKIKIVSPGEVKEHKFCIDYSSAGFSCARVFAITIDSDLFDIKYVLSLLNSALLKSYLQSFASLKNGGYYSYSSNILNRTPIKTVSKEAQQPFIEKADLMQSFNKELQTEKQNFINTLKEDKHLQKITKVLENFNELDFEGLKDEIGKQKAKFALGAETHEWREYFNSTKQKVNEIQYKINHTDKEIDRMVYKLYELTSEEIEIVENAVK